MRLFWGLLFFFLSRQRKVNTFVVKMHQGDGKSSLKALLHARLWGQRSVSIHTNRLFRRCLCDTDFHLPNARQRWKRFFFVGLFLYFCVSLAPSLCRRLPKQLDCSAREGKKTHLSDKQDTVCERPRIDPAFLQLFGLSYDQVVMRSPYGSLISFIDSEKNPITSPMPGFMGADEVLKRM